MTEENDQRKNWGDKVDSRRRQDIGRCETATGVVIK